MFTYIGQCKDGLSQNISALRYWSSDHYPSVKTIKKKYNGISKSTVFLMGNRNHTANMQHLKINKFSYNMVNFTWKSLGYKGTASQILTGQRNRADSLTSC